MSNETAKKEKTDFSQPATQALQRRIDEFGMSRDPALMIEPDQEYAQRMALDVAGRADDPFKAAVEGVIPARVDVHGHVTKDKRSI